MPPLRERQADIPLLALHFLEKYRLQLGCPPMTLSDEAYEALCKYAWPGNVRELENMMERAVVLCRGGEVGLYHFPQDIVASSSGPLLSNETETEAETADARDFGANLDLEARVADLESGLIKQALESASDNKAKAARLLKISERTLWYKLKKHGLGVTKES
jgi:two-component system response regulator AtoC